MMAQIKREFDTFTRQHKYILRCSGVLNGTPMGDTVMESKKSLHEINSHRVKLGLDIIRCLGWMRG